MGGDIHALGGVDGADNALQGDIVYARLVKYNATTGNWDRVSDLGASAKTADLTPSATNVVGLTNASQTYDLPTADGEYLLQAIGNTAYVNDGATPTMTVGGDGIVVAEGATIGPIKLAGPKLAAIASANGGYLYIVELT